jgi:small subunit ribosomal protein S1
MSRLPRHLHALESIDGVDLETGTMSQEEKSSEETSNGDEPRASEQEADGQPDVVQRGQAQGRATTRDEEGEESGGLNQYESKRKAGESVRVATAKDNPSQQKSPDEGDEADVGPRRRVALDDSESSDAEDDEASSDPPDDTSDASQKTDASSEATDVEEDGAPETDDGPQTAHIDPDDLEEQDGEVQEPDLEDLDVEMDDFGGADLEDATTEDFAQLYEQQEEDVPAQREYETGERVTGEVLSIDQEHIFVELDPHTNGIAKRREFTDDEGELEVTEGEPHEFYVVDVWEDENEVYLGRELKGQQGSVDAIQDAYESGVPVEGKVTGTNKGGFDVEVHGVDAFCPISEIEIGFTEEKDLHVGATYRFKVTEFEEGGDTIVLSRAALQREEREQQAEETLEQLDAGDTVEGVVTRTTGFGAFVDLGGVEGLIHVSELSHHTFDHPDDVVSDGQTVEVEVLEIEEPESEDDDPRISLSRKSTETNPWEEVNEKFAVGENVEGQVVRNAPFGAFVELEPGVEGLVHVSEMSWTEHVKTPDEVVEPGDKITVQIQDIDIPRQRISLSIKAAEGDPWDDVQERYAEEMEVQGTVENIEDFGVFVKLPSGITALLPRSEMNLQNNAAPHGTFDVEDTVTARVLDINPEEREMALTLRDEEERESGSSADSYEDSGSSSDSSDISSSSSGSDDGGGGFGTLGDMIGDQLQSSDE